MFAEAGRPVSRAALPPLRFRLNEIGWQDTIRELDARLLRPGVRRRVAEDRHQSDVYSALIPYYACDESVRSMLYYGLVDEPDLERWQAGLIRADGTRRPSYASVKSMLRGSRAVRAGPCAGAHDQGGRSRGEVRRAPPLGRGHQLDVRRELRGGEPVHRGHVPPEEPAAERGDAESAAGGGRRTPFAEGRLQCTREDRAHQGLFIRFKRKRLAAGYYVFAIRLRAEMNPTRTSSLVRRPFAVGKAR